MLPAPSAVPPRRRGARAERVVAACRGWWCCSGTSRSWRRRPGCAVPLSVAVVRGRAPSPPVDGRRQRRRRRERQHRAERRADASSTRSRSSSRSCPATAPVSAWRVTRQRRGAGCRGRSPPVDGARVPNVSLHVPGIGRGVAEPPGRRGAVRVGRAVERAPWLAVTVVAAASSPPAAARRREGQHRAERVPDARSTRSRRSNRWCPAVRPVSACV